MLLDWVTAQLFSDVDWLRLMRRGDLIQRINAQTGAVAWSCEALESIRSDSHHFCRPAAWWRYGRPLIHCQMVNSWQELHRARLRPQGGLAGPVADALWPRHAAPARQREARARRARRAGWAAHVRARSRLLAAAALFDACANHQRSLSGDCGPPPRPALSREKKRATPAKRADSIRGFPDGLVSPSGNLTGEKSTRATARIRQAILDRLNVFKGSALYVFPCSETICVSSMYDSGCCTGARKFNVLGKLKPILFVSEGAVL
jgi:hypothetical protein